MSDRDGWYLNALDGDDHAVLLSAEHRKLFSKITVGRYYEGRLSALLEVRAQLPPRSKTRAWITQQIVAAYYVLGRVEGEDK